MIATLRGILAEKSPGEAIVEAGGIGYRVAAPVLVTDRLPEVGAEVFLYTEMVVREDSQTLYGFLDGKTRALFCRLVKVSGVGAKTALAMLSVMPVGEFLSALASGDAARLSATPGIGAKTAQRLIIEFRGSVLLSDIPANAANSDTSQALAALGYKKPEIARALSALHKQYDNADEMPPAEQIKAALKILAKRGGESL
ncbi:MAG: Holliday junction branch migration protein RuvA [Gammaproteobacteria bacterium]